MPKKHISVVKAVIVWLFAILLILGGFAGMFAGGFAGYTEGIIIGMVIMIWGIIIGLIIKLVFKVRTKLLQIDTREAVRDKIGYVCPNCGQRIPESSSFCNNCGYKIR